MRRLFQSRQGTTLVELIVAILILSILATAAAESLKYAKSMATLQRGRRTALEVANGRLEDLRAAGWSQLTYAPTNTTSLRYLARTGTGWNRTTTDPLETVVINGRTRPITTTVQYMDPGATPSVINCLHLNVRVQYGPRTNEVVTLATVRTQ